MRRIALTLLVAFAMAPEGHMQSVQPVAFEVVSIKRTDPRNTDTSATMSRDGSMRYTNTTIRSLLLSASPVPAIDVVGAPDWADSERYDIIAKTPAGTVRSTDQRRAMIRQMLIDRTKLEGHVEQRERNTFALVLARRDRRLGPQLQASTLDCSNAASRVPPTADKPGCGSAMLGGAFSAGAMPISMLAASIRGVVGAVVNDRTGLTGLYDMTLRFSLRETAAPPASTVIAPSPDDVPDIFTAVQEQLGLKLQPEKTMETVFVIDHLERPTEN